MSDFTIEEMKKLRDLLDEKIKEEFQKETTKERLPLPFIAPYQFIIPLATQYLNRDNEEWCAIREYFKAHPNETSVMMVCFCKRCSPQCNSSVMPNDQTGTTITLSGTISYATISQAPTSWINQY